MSFYIRVKYSETSPWLDVVSSASHMIECTRTRRCEGKNFFQLQLPNGDVFSTKTGKWTQAPRNPNFL